jgi:hypothetical protein
MGEPPRALSGAVRQHAAGPAASAVAALAWLGLSWWHPEMTYHFGPPLAAVAWPVLLRARLRRPVSRAQALADAAGGFPVATGVLGIAIAERWLRGPTLIGSGGVPAEEIVLAICASAWGWRVAARRRRAWFLPAEPGQ